MTKVAGAVQIRKAARDAGPATRIDRTKPRIVNTTGEGRADGIVGLGRCDLHDGAGFGFGVGVDAELDARQLCPNDSIGKVSLGPTARTSVKEAHHDFDDGISASDFLFHLVNQLVVCVVSSTREFPAQHVLRTQINGSKDAKNGDVGRKYYLD